MASSLEVEKVAELYEHKEGIAKAIKYLFYVEFNEELRPLACGCERYEICDKCRILQENRFPLERLMNSIFKIEASHVIAKNFPFPFCCDAITPWCNLCSHCRKNHRYRNCSTPESAVLKLVEKINGEFINDCYKSIDAMTEKEVMECKIEYQKYRNTELKPL